jgi:hypothetical protein
VMADRNPFIGPPLVRLADCARPAIC